MQLKLKTDYALRVLLYLAHREALHKESTSRSEPVRPVSTESISESFGISKDHVVKVVQDLAQHGWVRTRAGRGGGIVLVADPTNLRVDEIVAAFEGRQGVLDCVAQPEVCVLEPGCDLRRLLIEAEQSFFDVLGSRSIADLVSRRPRRGGIHNLSIPSR